MNKIERQTKSKDIEMHEYYIKHLVYSFIHDINSVHKITEIGGSYGKCRLLMRFKLFTECIPTFDRLFRFDIRERIFIICMDLFSSQYMNISFSHEFIIFVGRTDGAKCEICFQHKLESSRFMNLDIPYM